MITVPAIFWTSPRYPVALEPLGEHAISVLSPLHTAGQYETSRRAYLAAAFRHLGDPIIAPSIDASPRSITDLVSEQTILVYCLDQRVPFLTLTGLTVIGKGLSIEGQRAGKFVVGAAKAYQLNLDVNQLEGVRGEIRWHFAHHDDFVIAVDAVNTPVWPYRPTYPVDEKWQWATAIIETRNKEQRFANAEHPLQSLTYHYHYDNARAIDNLRRFALKGKIPLVVPLWLDAIPNINVRSGDIHIAAAIGLRAFSEKALLYHSATDYEIIEISAVTALAITLSRPITREHSKATLVPVRFAIAPEGLQSSQNSRTRKQRITFQTLSPHQLDSLPWPTHYLGSPVIERYKTSRKESSKYDWQTKVTAANQRLYHLDRNIHRHTMAIDLLEPDWRTLQRRLMELQGRLVPLWFISNQNEVRIVKPCPRNKLVVSNWGFNERFPSGVHLHLTWQSGIEMTKATPNGFDEDGNEYLVIETNDGAEVQPSELRFGHIMRLMRATSDEWLFSHKKGVSTLPLSLIELPDEEQHHDRT